MTNERISRPSGFDAKFERFQTQRRRRIIVGLYLISLITMLVETGLVDSYLPVIPLFAFIAVATLFLYGSTRGIANDDSAKLDEQQISTRNAGYRQAYMIGITVAFAGGYWISQISDWDTAIEVGAWLSIFGFVSSLPTMIIAWTLPNDIADEDE
ncbi:hypothetical protein JYU04_03630 [Dehalococcoides mccartyi]|nr:hypothetical protein [Dehalococcoides mccartyi]